MGCWEKKRFCLEWNELKDGDDGVNRTRRGRSHRGCFCCFLLETGADLLKFLLLCSFAFFFIPIPPFTSFKFKRECPEGQFYLLKRCTYKLSTYGVSMDQDR